MVVSAALVVQLLAEAELPVPAQPLVAAPLPQEPELPALAHPVLVPPVLVPPVLAGRPVLAHLLVEAAGPVQQRLLSRQSFSAAWARSSS